MECRWYASRLLPICLANTWLGCDSLAVVEENVVLAFTEAGSKDNNRITVLLNKAYRVQGICIYKVLFADVMQLARQGSYGKALTMLLEPNAWRGLSISDYVLWAHEIWHILALRATRRFVYSVDIFSSSLL
jgi:anaphase-promoting complex subunit 5